MLSNELLYIYINAVNPYKGQDSARVSAQEDWRSYRCSERYMMEDNSN